MLLDLLEDDDLHALTGYKRHAEQIGWLADNGYHFDIRSDGRPNVLVRQVEERQGIGARDRIDISGNSKPVPDLAALDRTG